METLRRFIEEVAEFRCLEGPGPVLFLWKDFPPKVLLSHQNGMSQIIPCSES